MWTYARDFAVQFSYDLAEMSGFSLGRDREAHAGEESGDDDDDGDAEDAREEAAVELRQTKR